MEDNKTKEEILESVRLYHNKRTNDLLEVQYNRAEHGVILKAMEVYTQQSTKQLQDRIVEMTEALKWCQKLVDNMPDELYVKIEKLLNTKS